MGAVRYNHQVTCLEMQLDKLKSTSLTTNALYVWDDCCFALLFKDFHPALIDLASDYTKDDFEYHHMSDGLDLMKTIFWDFETELFLVFPENTQDITAWIEWQEFACP